MLHTLGPRESRVHILSRPKNIASVVVDTKDYLFFLSSFIAAKTQGSYVQFREK